MHPGCTIDQVYLYTEPIDFRKAIDGPSVLVELELGLSPFASQTPYPQKYWCRLKKMILFD